MKSVISIVCVLFIAIEITTASKQTTLSSTRHRRLTTCRFRGQVYQVGNTWSFQIGAKTFTCSCTQQGYPNCQWSTLPSTPRRCYDRRTRSYRTNEETWERHVNNRTLDCICEQNQKSRRMQIVCSAENRCHQNGVSYRTGDDWQARDITGLLLDCQCLGRERVSCRGRVTTDVPPPSQGAQWIEDHIVYKQQVLRPRIATLQACDTGSKVVSSGYTWNHTTEIGERHYTVEQCVCRDALIRCAPFTVSRHQDPHCVTDDGNIKFVGESWVKLHHSHSNIRWRCSCRGHGQLDCRDIGYCVEPHPPPNGAMICVVVGKEGPRQAQYCKPMCAQGYDFLNRQRYYRIWEVCSHVTVHRWSGGYSEDSLLLAKCRRPDVNNRIRGRSSLYLPTVDCQSLTAEQKREIGLEFIRLLKASDLCGNKCQLFWCKTYKIEIDVSEAYTSFLLQDGMISKIVNKA